MTEDELSYIIIGAALRIHKKFGPGVLESAYQECMYYELIKEGLQVEKEKSMPLVYENIKLDCGYRLDLLVEKKVVIEIKSVETLKEVHFCQVLTYLRLGDFKLGLLINFNNPLLKDGLNRIVNNL